MSKWRYAYASVKGTSHEKSKKPCQDSSLCTVLSSTDEKQIMVAVISDGAGSAKSSDVGSSLACALFIDEIRAFLETGNKISGLSRDFYQEWLMRFQQEISFRAKESNLSSREYACTFLSAVITDNCAVFAQIGDGAIVVDSPEEQDVYNWEFWPQQGEYENTTFFATEGRAFQTLQFSIHHGRTCNEVAMFTDGLQRLALHYQTQSAHSPFFRPFFSSLRKISDQTSGQYIASLETFLNSKQINDRTDDDKTLILATRIVEG